LQNDYVGRQGDWDIEVARGGERRWWVGQGEVFLGIEEGHSEAGESGYGFDEEEECAVVEG